MSIELIRFDKSRTNTRTTVTLNSSPKTETKIVIEIFGSTNYRPDSRSACCCYIASGGCVTLTDSLAAIDDRQYMHIYADRNDGHHTKGPYGKGNEYDIPLDQDMLIHYTLLRSFIIFSVFFVHLILVRPINQLFALLLL